jgi:hypothetical protein
MSQTNELRNFYFYKKKTKYAGMIKEKKICYNPVGIQICYWKRYCRSVTRIKYLQKKTEMNILNQQVDTK